MLEIAPLLKGVKALHFSPLSTYLLVCDRFEPKQEASDNCALYHLPKRCKVGLIKVRRLAAPLWPAMRWSPDEVFCLRITQDPGTSPNSPARILVLNSKLNKADTLSVGGLSSLEISNNGKLACFYARQHPNQGDSHARVEIFDLDTAASTVFTLAQDPADSAIIQWNSKGDTLLVTATMEVDNTGKTYYGKSNLLVFVTVKNTWKMLRPQELTSLQDAKWSPKDPRVFVAVAGPMPAQVSEWMVEEATITRTLNMGKVPRNTIRWNIHGRYAAVGGFGALPGDVDFWDISNRKVLKTVRTDCTVDCSWNPQGLKVFLTDSTSPRMRVDNSFHLYSYLGDLIAKRDYKELFGAVWKPAIVEALVNDTPTPEEALKEASELPVKKNDSQSAFKTLGGEATAALLLRATEGASDEEKPKSARAGKPSSSSAKPSKWDEVIDRSCLSKPAPAVVIQKPTPSADWFYKDQDDKIQGPFDLKLMQAWSKAGYFHKDLELKIGKTRPFNKLSVFFPDLVFSETIAWPYED